jgi:AcrR family transcriptional regulator
MAYRPTDKTEARRAEQRERIVAAATALVAENGYAAAQVAAVAAEAGVATGSVYRHFPSKGELLAEVFRRASQREVDAVAAAAATQAPAPERLTAAVETFATRAIRGRRLAWALLAEPVDPAVEAERLTYRRAYRDVFAAVLADGAAAGELDVADEQLAAAAIVGMIGEALVGPLSPGQDAADAGALAAHLAQLVTRSVTPRGTHVRHRAPEPQHA